MTAYPLFFSFTNIVKTDSYHAAVVTKGRALLIHHPGDSWVCSGVQPSGLDAEGEQAIDATKEFATEFQKLLEDIALGVNDFQDFRVRVQKFFGGANSEQEALWSGAVAAIQSGAMKIDPMLEGMERKPEAGERRVEVVLLQDLIPVDWSDQLAIAADFQEAA